MTDPASPPWTWSVDAPGGFRTGVPLIVRASLPLEYPVTAPPAAYLQVRNGASTAAGSRAELTELNLEPLRDRHEWMREFSVSLPGEYAVTFAGQTKAFQAVDSSFISFGREFGLFSAATVTLVIAMLAWLARDRRRQNLNSLPKETQP
jgi:hypothetical protein